MALSEAAKALERDEVPVGAIVVRNGLLLGRGFNQMLSLNDPTAHAEMIAITAACEKTGEIRLDGADIFVTLEPCSMCAGALVLARIKRLFYAAVDEKTGACGSVFDIVREPRLNHQVEVYSGFYAGESKSLLQEFFRRQREKRR